MVSIVDVGRAIVNHPLMLMVISQPSQRYHSWHKLHKPSNKFLAGLLLLIPTVGKTIYCCWSTPYEIQFLGCIMWVKQCHKPPIPMVNIPPMYGDDLGIVFPTFFKKKKKHFINRLDLSNRSGWASQLYTMAVFF